MSFSGTWNIIMKTPMGDRQAVMILAEDGATLTGTMEADGTQVDVKDGAVSGGRATWKADLTSPMPLTLEFDVGKDGDNMEGAVKLGMFGSSTVTGTPA